MSPLCGNNTIFKIRNIEFMLTTQISYWIFHMILLDKYLMRLPLKTAKTKDNSKSNSQHITSKFLSQVSVIFCLLLHNSQ